MSVALDPNSIQVTSFKMIKTEFSQDNNNVINTTQTEYSETKTDVLTDVTTAPQVNSLHSEHAPAELNGEPVINAQSVLTVETFPDQETKLADETANNAHSTKVDSAHIDSVLVPASSGPQAHVISSSLPAERDTNDPLPAENLWAVKREEPVILRMKDKGPGSEKPLTVPEFLKMTAQKIPNKDALAVKRNGQWMKLTYAEYYNSVIDVAKGFIKLGLEPYKGVGIIGFNSPEWFLADLGAIFAGGLAVGIYTTNSPEACQYVASNSEANIIVVENNQQLQKILKVKHQLPELKAIVQYTGEVASREPFIYSWTQLMKLAEEVPDDVLKERMKLLAPNKCCTLIYTSGTTGNPKGVMLSHDNLTWTALSVAKASSPHLKSLPYEQLCLVSYLPLSHVAAQLLDMYCTIKLGGTVYFAQPDALKGSLQQTLLEVRPHVFFGVPRVWEKFQEAIQSASRNLPGYKKKLSNWAQGIGLKGNYSLMNGDSYPFGWSIAKSLVFKRVRKTMGLDRCYLCLSGAAPITKETLDFFLGLDIQVFEVYGMSESSGPHCTGFPGLSRVTSVGPELPGIKTRLHNPDGEGNGEIVMSGRHIFMGYLNEEAKTRETLDDNGDLKTGDIGRKDNQGYLYVTGRIKELIITAGGENVAPIPIEDAVKEALPIVSQCMVVGDKKKFLSMLLTLKTVINPDTLEPSDNLTQGALDWCHSIGSKATTVSYILSANDTAILNAIQKGIDKANSQSVSNAQKIQKWSILPKDFSVPGGELGPTMKMRRPIISKMYMKTINAFYEE